MDELRQKIESFQRSTKGLEPDQNTREKYLETVQDFANRFINALPHTNTFNSEPTIPGSFSDVTKPIPLLQAIDLFEKEVAKKGINPASGGHLGYIPGGGIYTSALADYMAAVTNEYAGIYYASPGSVDIENELLDWMKDIFGFPISAVGNLASGGSIANLIALTSARDHHNVKGAEIEKSVVYMSRQVHHCINKALRIIGLEDVVIRYLEMDEHHRIEPASLEKHIAADQKAGLNPFLLIASAGTTDTGAIDPLDTLGEIAGKHKLWYHVDAAYGGFFILTDSRKARFKGIELADSMVIDPHKGLFLPYGLGVVLVKDVDAVFHSHRYTANYMQDAQSEKTPISPADVSPELTKHFRGLRLWLPLKIHGLEPFKACLEEKLLLTEYFRLKLLQKGFKLGPEPDLSVSYFWYPREDPAEENSFNAKLLEAIHEDGSVYLSSTILDDKFVIRMAILSFRTHLEDIDRAVGLIDRLRRHVSSNFFLP